MSGAHEAGSPAITLPGLPADIDHHRVITQMMRRASSPGFDAWWRRADSVGFCANPIQLIGTDDQGHKRTAWVRCNNRRATVCPSCSDLYARDTWQLVAAGTTGGRHNITPSVADRPQVFATLTAPSFGPVHGSAGSVCRDHRTMGCYKRCPHGKPLWCSTIHDSPDLAVGQPLCAKCYDYLGHVLFTWHLPELWRRFTIALRRNLAKHLKAAGIASGSVKASFVKVVEMQARAIPHIHALIRLDPPDDPAGTGPAWGSPISAAELAALIQQAARAVTLDVPNPDTDQSGDAAPLLVRFGAQIDTQPLRTENHTAPTESSRRIAGYLAKYVTKSLQDFGIAARRLSAEAIADLDVTEHVRAILTTIAHLADQAHTLGIDALAGIGRWLHALGYRGHVTTKSRRYSVTMGALRAIRATWARQQAGKDCSPQHHSPLDPPEKSDDVWWEFDHAGHATPGDRTLVYSAALRSICTRRVGLVEARRQARDQQ
ncbi:replication initiator [Mycobacterium sp. E3247]|uniref:replication initiator n=1 Tax=Mycobacterium sp. E3247 TaxID=1856864 RepID=UPI0007FECF0E|nr:replication initiator [Mycobacterium sp. E3247]OBH15081.1 plasmid replication initiator protein [Mycobacterium sp. E3247]